MMSLLVRIDLAYSKSQELKNSRIPHDVPVAYIRRSIGIEYRLEAYATFRQLPRLCGEAKTTAQAISKREVWSGRLLLG
jgi:hypothetical protein